GRNVASDQIEQAALAEPRLITAHLRLKLQEMRARLALFVKLASNLAQRSEQILGDDRLQQIFGHADLDGLLGISELVVAAEDNDLDRRQRLFEQAAELQAIHK